MRTLIILGILLLLAVEAPSDTPDLRLELNRARSLERSGNLTEALTIYESIFQKHPEYQPGFNYLRNAYMKAQMYDELIEACAVARKIRPRDTSVYMALGEAFAAKGEEEKAKQAWEEIIAVDPKNRSHYAFVGYELSRHRMYEDEIAVYKRGEEAIGEHAYARELSRAYERMGEPEKAAEEVLNLLVLKPKDVLNAERELKRLMARFGNSAVMGVVETRAANQPETPSIHRVLGDLYLLHGEYDLALQEYTKSGAQEPLWELGQKAEHEGLHQAALNSYRTLAESKGPHSPAARFRIGGVLEASGKYDESINAYREFIHQFPKDAQVPRAKYRIGVIRLNGLSDPNGALVYFEGLADSDAGEEVVLDSKYMVAECNLRLGNVDVAARELVNLIELSPSDRALHLLGEVTYYQGDFDSSLALHNRLANEFLESDLVNDALSRSVFISNNGEDTKLLQRFAGIERLVHSRDLESAVHELRLFLNDEQGSALADDAMLLLGEVLETKMSYNEAIGAYRDVIDLFPESTLRPEAQKRIGEIFAERLNNKKAAIDELEKVLLYYPDYVLTTAVRNRIEELREDQKE